MEKEASQNLVEQIRATINTSAEISVEGRSLDSLHRHLLDPFFLSSITKELYKDIWDIDNFQIAGVESAALPLVTALVSRAHQAGKNVNGFYIRKSRNKHGNYFIVEGEPNNNPVILVDDIINSGLTLHWALTQLSELNLTTSKILSIIQYRPSDQYSFLSTHGVKLVSLYQCPKDTLAISLPSVPMVNNHQESWSFVPETASHKHVVQKSIPLVDEQSVYFGTDQGIFYCLDRNTGHIHWQHQTGRHIDQKNIFSSPAILDTAVLFGSYDGRLYALDKETGDVLWIYDGCDCIGSSPSVSKKHNLVFIGLEHNGPGDRNGSIAALDVITGERVWEQNLRAYTHASPIFLENHDEVAIGSNEGILYLFAAETGVVKWQFETEGGQRYDGVGGFSPGDIKAKPVYDEATDALFFGSVDGFMYAVKRSSGEFLFRSHAKEYNPGDFCGIYGYPCVTEKHVLFASTDKHIYCLEKHSGKEVWSQNLRTRIFSSPAVHDGVVFIGTNSGRVYELAEASGERLGVTQLPDRVTSPVVITGSEFFVATNKNSVHCFQL